MTFHHRYNITITDVLSMIEIPVNTAEWGIIYYRYSVILRYYL